MVGVGMRKDHGGESSPTAGPQLRGDDAHSHVDRTASQTPSIDHERLAVRQVDDRGVPLAHVKESGAEDAPWSARATGAELEKENCGDAADHHGETLGRP